MTVAATRARIVATAVFDAFGVQRFGTGTLSAGVLRATYGNGNEDGMSAFLNGRAQRFGPQKGGGGPKPIGVVPPDCQTACENCMSIANAFLTACLAAVGAGCAALMGVCSAVCITSGVWTGGVPCAICFGIAGIGCLAAFAGCFLGYQGRALECLWQKNECEKKKK